MRRSWSSASSGRRMRPAKRAVAITAADTAPITPHGNLAEDRRGPMSRSDVRTVGNPPRPRGASAPRLPESRVGRTGPAISPVISPAGTPIGATSSSSVSTSASSTALMSRTPRVSA